MGLRSAVQQHEQPVLLCCYPTGECWPDGSCQHLPGIIRHQKHLGIREFLLSYLERLCTHLTLSSYFFLAAKSLRQSEQFRMLLILDYRRKLGFLFFFQHQRSCQLQELKLKLYKLVGQKTGMEGICRTVGPPLQK